MDPAEHFISVASGPDWGPLVALAVVAVILVGLFVSVLRRRTPRQSPRWRGRPALRLVPAAAPAANPADPHAQMRAVQDAAFERVRLLNREEARLLPLLETVVNEAAQGYRVMAQTSLGEVIRPIAPNSDPDLARQAFAAINSKRLDFAIFDRGGYLVCAIEYQGTGHYHATTFLRDAVKREALRKAGVPMVEVRPDFNADTLRADIAAFLRGPRQAASG